MAHEVETMFTARELPWHGLGTFVPDLVKSDEALILAGLDWEVYLDDVFTAQGEAIGEHKFTRRSDTHAVLGVVGERYHPIQNHQLFEFTDNLVDYGARYESAGSLRSGKYVFTTMVVERELNIAGDVHVPYIVMASSHDGSMATRAMLSPVRVVCMNTLRLAISRSPRSFTIRHTRSATQRIDEARRALGIAFNYYDGFEDEVKAMIDQTVTEQQFDELIEAVWPEKVSELKGNRDQKKRDGVKAIYLHDPTVAEFKGTAWGALNAFNTWELWEAPIRRTKNTSEDVRVARQERQAVHVLRDNTGLTEKVQKLLVKAR